MNARAEIQELFNALVARHGGVERFDAAQIEIARTVIQLMLDLRTAAPGESVKIADAMTRLMDRLPAPPPPPPPAPKDPSLVGLSVMQLSRLYERMVANVGEGLFGPRYDD